MDRQYTEKMDAMIERCKSATTITIDGTTAPCQWDGRELVILHPVTGKRYASLYPKDLMDPAYKSAVLA